MPSIQQAWQTPTLVNSWINFGASYATAAYMKDSMGFVHLRGLIKSGASGSVVFTLPVGYRPLDSLYYIINTSGSFGDCVIASNGAITVYGANAPAYCTLSPVIFKAEQ